MSLTPSLTMMQPRHENEAASGEHENRRVSVFARRLLSEWKRLAPLVTGTTSEPRASLDDVRVVLAVSGGADSTALILAFHELSKAELLHARAKVAHMNHGLRGQHGDDDARWVAELASAHGFEFETARSDVRERAARTRDNLEQAARRARYEFLGAAARAWNATAILTAHTLDDQAETILLSLLRGSGAEGLGGIRPVRPLDARGDVSLVRPILRWARRRDTENYCRECGVAVRLDEMNADETFARVRVRRKLLPLLESFNPRAVEALSRTAELLREDASALDALAAKLLDEAYDRESDADASPHGDDDVDNAAVGESGAVSPPLRVEVLARAAVAVRRRALRQWIARGRGDLRRVEMTHVLAVERLLAGVRGGRVVELPGGGIVERRRGRLTLSLKFKNG